MNGKWDGYGGGFGGGIAPQMTSYRPPVTYSPPPTTQIPVTYSPPPTMQIPVSSSFGGMPGKGSGGGTAPQMTSYRPPVTYSPPPTMQVPVTYSPPPAMQIPVSAGFGGMPGQVGTVSMVPFPGAFSMLPISPAFYGAPVTTLSMPAESTDEDIQKRILAMLPAGSKYLGKAADAPFTLALDMDFNSIGDHGAFKNDVAKDVATAAKIDARHIKVTGLRAGSVVVDMLIAKEAGNVKAIVKDLEDQVKSPNSLLKQGKVTSKAKGGEENKEEADKETPLPPMKKEDNARNEEEDNAKKEEADKDTPLPAAPTTAAPPPPPP